MLRVIAGIGAGRPGRYTPEPSFLSQRRAAFARAAQEVLQGVVRVRKPVFVGLVDVPLIAGHAEPPVAVAALKAGAQRAAGGRDNQAGLPAIHEARQT